jgi:hypothetical protein
MVPVLDTLQMEVTLANHYDLRRNLIVPNVHWGLGFLHEIDMLIVTKSGYASEIEIKISKSDLKHDMKKKWAHNNFIDNPRIKTITFAMPESMVGCVELVPEYAGIALVKWNEEWTNIHGGTCPAHYSVEIYKKPRINHDARKLSADEIKHLYVLSAMRIWSYKQTKINDRNKITGE